jgi:hypothetical protein
MYTQNTVKHTILPVIVLLAVLLATAATSRGSEPVGEMSSTVTLGVRVSHQQTERPTLTIRGTSFDSQVPGEYTVTASLPRIPCPGKYHFVSEGEDQANGNSNSYTASIILSHFATTSQAMQCGTRLPRAAGKASVVLAGPDSSTPLQLSGWRSQPEAFSGTLILQGLPECDEPYTLIAHFSLRGWRPTFTYKVNVAEAKVAQQGIEATPPGC